MKNPLQTILNLTQLQSEQSYNFLLQGYSLQILFIHMENINSAFQNTLKQTAQAKAKFWDNKTNKIALLSLLAAILISLFFYHQFARRHFAISATTQRHHNQKLKNQLQELAHLNKTLSFLQNVDSNSVVQPEFAIKLNNFGIKKISHQRQLLANCSKQFEADQKQVSETQDFILGINVDQL